MSEQDDAKASSGCRDAEQFVELLGAQERHLAPYVYSLTGDWNDTEEVVQRVRLKLWRQFDQYDRTLSFGAWARAIAYYEVRTYRKQKQRRPEYLTESVVAKLSNSYEELPQTNDWRHEALQECLSKLKSQDRDIVAEYYSTQFGEIGNLSEKVGVSVQALRQKIYRIRKMLFECVERKLG